NPGPGEIGSLQKRTFSGPWVFDMDAGIQKLTHLTEKHTIEFRMEAGNVFNHPAFFTTGFNINSTKFGQITGTFTDRRVIQFGLDYRFTTMHIFRIGLASLFPALMLAQNVPTAAADSPPLDVPGKLYFHYQKVYSPFSLLESSFQAAILQWNNDPREWGQGYHGLWRRTASTV